jgi:hypothetical protein
VQHEQHDHCHYRDTHKTCDQGREPLSAPGSTMDAGDPWRVVRWVLRRMVVSHGHAFADEAAGP